MVALGITFIRQSPFTKSDLVNPIRLASFITDAPKSGSNLTYRAITNTIADLYQATMRY